MKSRTKKVILFALALYLALESLALAQVDTASIVRFKAQTIHINIADTISSNIKVIRINLGNATENHSNTIQQDDTILTRKDIGLGSGPDLTHPLPVERTDDIKQPRVVGSIGGEFSNYTLNQVDTAWIRRFVGPPTSSDEARAMVVDSAGNVYVTGRSTGLGSGYDYATVKFASNGDTVWVRRYNGPGNANDIPNAIAVDSSGNVYVTGKSWGSGSGYDFATIKYSPNGDELWVRRYNGSTFEDEATALAIDKAGNVLVTGHSDLGFPTGFDWVTIKYAANGNVLWGLWLDGGNSNDIALAQAVDSAGNVYVAGRTGTNIDFTTVKYTANGNFSWALILNGPGNGFDIANALTVDNAGYIYATGYTQVTGGGETDYLTIKQASSGDTLWVRRYDGPATGPLDVDAARALAVDTSGNVYVTGGSKETNWDYATIKYAPNGDTLWARRYYPQVNGDDVAYALAVDDSGNIYVTGVSTEISATIKYASNGDTLWVRRDSIIANAVAVGPSSGNIYVSGSAYGGAINPDFAVIKYAPNGDSLGVSRYRGIGGADYARALQVDQVGNVYVTGGSGGDYNTIKYAPNGDTLWVRRYNGPGNGYDQAYDLAVDNSGNIYVTGGSPGSGTGIDYAAIKYAPNGDTLWVRRYNGPGAPDDVANAVAVDSAGNVYVTGRGGSSTGIDYTTIKYASNGDSLWVRQYNGPGNGTDEAKALKLDNVGNIYVTGSSQGYATIKYSPSGETLWVRRYDALGNGSDMAHALAVDDSGNVYVTGGSVGNGTDYDYATIKYSASGDTLWVRRYNSPGNYYDLARALTLDDSGNVYVTGSIAGDYGTIKYTPNGDASWVRQYNGPGNGSDQAYALAVDSAGNTYVTGTTWSGTSYDYATVKYSPNGNILWVTSYNGPGDSTDWALALAVDEASNVYVTGYSFSEISDFDYTTIKYIDLCSLDPANQKPVISSLADTTIQELDSLQICMSITDPDGDPLTVTAEDMPDSNASFVNTGGNMWCFTFEPDSAQAGVYYISFVASDGCVDTIEQVMITVNNAPALISTTPDSLHFNVGQGDSAVGNLIIANQGGGFLNWTINASSPAYALKNTAKNIKAFGSQGNVSSVTSVPIPFFESFEDGNYDGWVDDYGVGIREVTSTTAAHGIYSFHYQNSSIGHYQGIHIDFNPGSQPEYVSFYVRAGSTSANTAYFVIDGDALGTTAIHFSGGLTGKFFVNDFDANYFYNANQWYFIEFRDINWTSKNFDYYINGVLLGANIPFINGTVNQFYRLSLYNYNPTEAWWDGIYFGSPPVSWLSATPTFGSVPVGSVDSVRVKVDATGLDTGQYAANITVNSNDPGQPQLTIPVRVTVTAADVTAPIVTVIAPNGGESW